MIMDLLAVCLKRGSLQLYGVSVNDVRSGGEALLRLLQLLESDKAEAPGASDVVTRQVLDDNHVHNLPILLKVVNQVPLTGVVVQASQKQLPESSSTALSFNLNISALILAGFFLACSDKFFRFLLKPYLQLTIKQNQKLANNTT